jgi:L-serine deaminase
VQVKTRFGTDLAAEEAGFDAGIETSAETHAQQIQACDAKVVGSAGETARLSRVRVACQAGIAGLIAQRLRLQPRPCPMAPASSS